MKNRLNDGIKVLVHGDLSKLEKLMSRHFPSQLKAVSDDMTGGPKTVEELNNYISQGKFTHVVIPDEHFHGLEGDYRGCIVPVIELLGDHWVTWATDGKKKYMEENGIRDAFVFTDRFLGPYQGIANFHSIPQGFDATKFTDRNQKRDIDVLIHGSLGEDTHAWVYPVRNWLAEILPEIGEREGINVITHSHPGYSAEEGSKRRHDKEYAEVLNRSKIAIGGSSHWRLLLKKFYEVPASGTILLSDLPLDDTELFRGKILEVDPNKIDSVEYVDEVKRKIMETLENYDSARQTYQPFRTEQDKFDRSYEGRALKMRAILANIRK